MYCKNSCLDLSQLEYKGYLINISTSNKDLVVHQPVHLIQKLYTDDYIVSLLVLDHSKIVINSKTSIKLINEFGLELDIFEFQIKLAFNPILYPLKMLPIKDH